MYQSNLPVLILTKSLIAEERLQNQLQKIDYEVLVSRRINTYEVGVHTNFQCLSYFWIVIFSETLTDLEVTQLLETKRFEGKILLRKTDNISKISIDTGSENQSLIEISHDCDLNELMMTLDSVQHKHQTKRLAFTQAKDSERFNDKMVMFLQKLTKNEIKVVEILLENYGQSVSREEMSARIWGTFDESKKVQLSALINRIKKKAEDSRDILTIVTFWGRGYSLKGPMGSHELNTIQNIIKQIDTTRASKGKGKKIKNTK